MSNIKYVWIYLVTLIFWGAQTAFSQDDEHEIITNYEFDLFDKIDFDYQPNMHSDDLFGDKYDNGTGTIKFEWVDISIPGNSSLEVALRRSYNTTGNDPKGTGSSVGGPYSKGTFYFELPRIEFQVLKKQSAGTNPVSESLNHYWPQTFIDNKHCSEFVSFTDFKLIGHTTYESGAPGIFTEVLSADKYTNSFQLIVPGQINDTLLKNNDQLTGASAENYRYTTKSKWKINCLDTLENGQAGEGFIATSPQGVTYTFGKIYYDDVSNNSFDTESGVFTTHYYKFLVTRVEDRFGNWVTYSYSDGELASMVSNDGRSITLNHSAGTSGNEIHATANGRVWKYRENELERPDGKKWSYNMYHHQFRNHLSGSHYEGKAPIDCGFIAESVHPYFDSFHFGINGTSADLPVNPTISITHPDGAVGEFWLGYTSQGDTNVSTDTDEYTGAYEASRCSYQFSLLKKRISYALGKNYEWTYEYSQNEGHYPATSRFPNGVPAQLDKAYLTGYIPGNVNNFDYKTVKVIKPDGSYVVSYVNRDARSYVLGKVFAEVYYSAANTKTKEVRYAYEGGTQFGQEYLKAGTVEITGRGAQQPRLTQRQIQLFDAAGTATTYTQAHSAFTVYDFPGKSSHTNSFNGKQRHYKFTYHNDTTNWVLGQQSQMELSATGNTQDYNVVRTTTFHSATGNYKSLPNCYYAFGTLNYCHTSYHTSSGQAGLPNKITLNAANRWVEYSDYKRGRPQTIKKPQSVGTGVKYAYSVVDDNGWITKFTDYEGHCTRLGYNPVGLRTLIDPCDDKWANTVIDYTTTTGTEGLDFVEAGMFKQTVNQGNYQKITYFDTMLRPRLSKEWDKTKSATARYVRSEFDYQNRPTFESKPYASAVTPDGVTTSYDALGRTKSVYDNTNSGSMTYTYLSGNRVKVNNNRGHDTTTTYLAYGSPTQKEATLIASPEGVNTQLNYNLYGNVTSITQGGITEHRVYSNRQDLCKTVRPDVGNTAFSYNALGEMLWSASGSSVGSSTTSCDTTVNSSEKVTYTYDNLGNTSSVNYGDNTPDLAYVYDQNGNVTQLTAGSVIHSYGYNDLNNIDSESISIDGKTFALAYGFDVLGNINNMTYPSGKSVALTNNALGQTTALSNYVTSAIYHPSGTLNTATLANGVTYQVGENNRQLPNSLIVSSASGVKLSNLSYYYDANANIEEITDLVDDAYTIHGMKYDGLDRLTDANGYWGTGKLTYDTMGNILTKKLGSESLTYQYDSATKILESVTGGKDYLFSYDVRGNVVENGYRPFTYNLANQMTDSNGVSYIYDGHNRRVKKTVEGKTTYSVYSNAGTMLYLQKENGDHMDHLYLNGKLVTTVESR